MKWARFASAVGFSAIVIGGCSGDSNTAVVEKDASIAEAGDGGDPGTLGGGLGEDGGTGTTDGSIFNDASLDVNGGDACKEGDGGPPPFAQRCAPKVLDECAGSTDQALGAMGVTGARLNGAGGNGFDDDCDGLVDEGCKCPGSGQTKDCYLVPASQADPATGKPVGWCTQNSKGSLECAGVEFSTWSGRCRGAQPPYAHDVCAIGDFNCDGLQANSDLRDCTCKYEPVQCPTTPLIVSPYPAPASIAIVDGSQWITSAADRASATNWSWTVVGGDCDNVLPFPTFAIYNQSDSTVAGARKGTRMAVKYDATLSPARYVAAPSSPLVAIRADNYGNGIAGSQVHPAFGLSGDYIVQGEWDLNGTHYVCTQKVQARAPGIRAELCWDTVGDDTAGNDLDLHVARLQGVACPTKGWDITCPQGNTFQDCWYLPGSGCQDKSVIDPSWGYADSQQDACVGWSSRRHPKSLPDYPQGCTNPRLDKDNVKCNPLAEDPTALDFCGPENINLDNPNDGDRFVVGVSHFGTRGGSADAKPHVNIYCNGVRVLSAGNSPSAGTNFPVLKTPGGTATGDLWTAATITAHVSGGQLTACDVSPIPSHHADPLRDGPSTQPAPNDDAQACVDSMANSTPSPNQYNYTSHAFVDHASLQGDANGSIPTTAAGFCKH